MTQTRPRTFLAALALVAFAVVALAFAPVQSALASTKPAKANIASMKSGAPGSITLKAKKAKRAQGYRFRIGTNKSLTKNAKVKTTTSRKATFKKLKRGKRYYAKVRAYRTVRGKKVWGKWSARKSVATLADEQPKVPRIAATGNAAVVVSALSSSAGKPVLVACDENTKTQAGSLLARCGIGETAALWKGDGTESGSLSATNLKKLIAMAPDLVFVTEGDGTLTEKQKQEIVKANTDVYVLPAMTSASRIRFAVEAIGAVLASYGVEGAARKCKEYIDFEAGVVNKYASANGGLAGGFDFDKGADADAADGTVATLFVDGWDSGARFHDPNGILDSSQGVAVATLGYATSPLSYYLSVGGVLNNAASKKVRKLDANASAIVWQFAENELDYRFRRWTGLSMATFDLAANVVGGLFRSNLLCYTDEGSHGLGTARFPAVVTASREIASKFVQSAQREGGIYHACPSITPAGHGATIGYFTDVSESTFVEACIGSDGSGASALEGTACEVLVNPKGLAQRDAGDRLCSWTKGSPESVLEASWAHWKFRGGSESAFRNDVKDFYSFFYGYELSSSELAEIVSGAES